MSRALVYGVAVAGQATAVALAARGHEVLLADDSGSSDAVEAANRLGLDLVVAPTQAELERLLPDIHLLSPSPGVPESHPVIGLARGRSIPVRSEIDLAYEWEQSRAGGPRPLLAITGTDGKTTTTAMTEAMLAVAGVRAVSAGNTDLPLVTALDLDVDAFVVECSSFRLAFTSVFRAEAAAWLNLAPDHLNWHVDLATYEAAKARLWRHVRADDLAVGHAGDPVVMAHLRRAPCRQRTFGLTGADYSVVDDALRDVLSGPDGTICATGVMRRSLPHDRTNALAAAALVLETGLADREAVGRALADFVGPPHRIELVGEHDGVSWYDDSKATTTHAALAAIGSFDSVVLIAGGQNKGLDLSVLADAADRLRAVVAFGEVREELREVFGGIRPVSVVDVFDDVVATAAGLARPGDVVLLSPACASFDTHDDYAHRGDEFARVVRAHLDQPHLDQGEHR